MAQAIGESFFRVTSVLRKHHNYRLDTAWTGEYLTRTPDRQFVRLAYYQQQLVELAASTDGDED